MMEGCLCSVRSSNLIACYNYFLYKFKYKYLKFTFENYSERSLVLNYFPICNNCALILVILFCT